MLAFDHLLEQMAVGVLGNPHVELQVLTVNVEAEAIVVAGVRQAIEKGVDVLGQSPQLAPLRRRGPLGEESRRLRFERFAELVELAHVGPGRHLDAGPGAGPRLDQAVLLEPLQGVADGQNTHAELPRQPTPRQRRARPNLTSKDFVSNRDVGLVGEAHRHICMCSRGKGGKRSRRSQAALVCSLSVQAPPAVATTSPAPPR